MAAPIALQLYTLREAMAKDFAGTIRKVAAMGYVGVETAGFPGTTPQEASKLFKELGLVVSSAHSRLPLGEHQNEVLETMAALGCKYLISPNVGTDYFKSIEGIKQARDLLNEANAVAAANGLRLGLHNHWWEFERVEGQYPYDVLLDGLDPAICFELDTYWTKVAGVDPVQVIKKLGARAPLLHIKDGPGVQKEPQVAVGEGIMDIPAIIQAGGSNTEWLVVELDHCATDMVEAVKKSYAYLVGNGLARGNKKP
jgi:sugar phosphate isomerase/epimerase